MTERIEPIYEGDQGPGGRTRAQKIYRFDNGYGASTLIDGHGYAEVLAIKFFAKGLWDWDTWKDGPLTIPEAHGIIGGAMSPDEVQEVLRKIRDLDPAEVSMMEGK